jgi:hypothetical protein
MSKTPKPADPKASTVAPKTGTQKKAAKGGVLTMDVDTDVSDDEEDNEKVLLEKPNEKKGTKTEWTDEHKATLWKLRDAVVEKEENKNTSGKTVNMSSVWKNVKKEFAEHKNGRADASTETISKQHSKLQQRKKKTNAKLLQAIKEQSPGCPYKDECGTYNTGHTEASAMEFVARLWWECKDTQKPKEFVYAEHEKSELFLYFWNEKLVFKDARQAAASAVDTQRMVSLQHNDKTDGEGDLDADAEGDNEEDETESEGALLPGESSHEAMKRKQRGKREKAAAKKKKSKPNAKGVAKGNAARRADAKKKELEERINLKAKAMEEAQKNVLKMKGEMQLKQNQMEALKAKIESATSEKKKKKYGKQLNQLLELPSSSSSDDEDD